MATPNVGILTNAGKNLIDQVNAGQTKITFSKIIFSSMDNNQLTDDQIKALTTVAPQEIVVNNPEVTLDNNTGETRIRATGNNEALTDGAYVKTYAVYAKDDSGNEILYGITVSPNPNYLPEYDGVTPQAVTYSYKVNISNTSNITFTNSNDVYVSDTDLAEALQPYAKTVDVNQQLDKKVSIADMRKPASDVAGIEEVNAKQDAIVYTPADDSKVVHNTGDEEVAGQKTFDVAPIDKTTGNPYITKDGVPSIPSDVARTGQSQVFTAAQTFSSAPTVTDTTSSKGDNQVALMGDLKSVEASAWHQLDLSNSAGSFKDILLYKIDKDNNNILIIANSKKFESIDGGKPFIDLSNLINNVTSVKGKAFVSYSGDSSDLKSSDLSFSNNIIILYRPSDSNTVLTVGENTPYLIVGYDSLVN
ncbi:hypothetical protein [Lentilactobacillus hilgardii]|uniref:hypothetical protein n=1 Tax=Lentilactobacillus hilgardii TaxID=1588 RepID=UPI0021C3D523|nr:hypothetical protein [Lentilactobacillus hilgardii]MCP9332151.1 hypothetical protein [Lentilactobacillus hilgardii]MCP9348781.1 hypothetical protein [Lentilactobacillus hilgardii]MCP9351640.1 hypothetical protein [Lentilactobacillus hilgardii]